MKPKEHADPIFVNRKPDGYYINRGEVGNFAGEKRIDVLRLLPQYLDPSQQNEIENIREQLDNLEQSGYPRDHGSGLKRFASRFKKLTRHKNKALTQEKQTERYDTNRSDNALLRRAILRLIKKNLLPIGAIGAAIFTLSQQDGSLGFGQQAIANSLNNQDKQISLSIENTNISPAEKNSGNDLIDHFGLRDRIVYLIYGRPQKYENQKSWGSLSETMTAEESWQLYQQRKVSLEAELKNEDITDQVGLGVLNPVYLSNNDPINDQYVEKALELAPSNNGVVALSFNSIQQAKDTITRLQTIVPGQNLKYLSVSLDLEWFGEGSAASIDAQNLNEFSNWYAQLHKTWDPDKSVPGFVFIYTINPINGTGAIHNLNQVNQYYNHEGVFVVPVADGFGTDEQKLHRLSQLVNGENGTPGLTNTQENPALAGTMEFISKWNQTYDKATITQIYSNLRGAPMKILASQ